MITLEGIMMCIGLMYLTVAFCKFVLLMGGLTGMVQAVREGHYIDNPFCAVVVCMLSLFATSILWITYIREEGISFFSSQSNKQVQAHITETLKDIGENH